MLFDAYNPWARLIELNSTHPLTVNRIAHLADIAKQKGQPFAQYDIAAAAVRVRLDRGALWRQFVWELGILLVPIAAAIIVGLLGALPLSPAAAALGVLATIPIRFPSAGQAAGSVVELMTNPAASPVIGRLARLEGKAIGRANPGFFAGEDVIYQDSTGILTIDFRSMLGFLGDLFAGWKRVPKHLDQQGNVTGWFRRSMGGYVILKELTSTAGVLRARPYFWQALLSVLVIVGTAYVALVGIGDISVPFEDNAATEAPEAP